MNAKRLLVLALMAIFATSAWAYDFSAVAPSGQTLYYNIVAGNAEVTCQNTSSPYYNTYPTGNLVIPSSVTNEGSTYNVTSIGNRAFHGCSGLTSVTIPNSVTSIGDYAFYGCSGLTSVNYTGTIAQWCGIDFSGYSSNPTSYSHTLSINGSQLTNLVIPEGVTEVKKYAFYNCSGLTSVTIPNSVTSIGERAFYNCSGLTSVTIPNSVTSIGTSAFYNIRHIEYYGNATGAPWGAKSMNGFTEGDFVYFNNTKDTLIAYIGTGGNVTIPNSVTSIGNYAFHGCSGLTSVTIPNSVTSIGNYAFHGCSGLTSVTIPNSVTSISVGAFEGCSGLTSVTIPNSVISIGNYAFHGCSGLTSVTIPNSVTSIGERAFYGCSGLTSVTFNADSCTSAGSSYTYRAFYGCTNITNITFGDNVKVIPSYLCWGLSSLTSVTIHYSVTSIGGGAFNGCSSLTSVTIPNSVTSIGGGAFYGCSGLTSVTFNADSCTSVGSSSNSNAFFGCTNITNITFGDNVKVIPSYLCGGLSSLTSVTIPNSVTSIGSFAFSGCRGLTSITIPNSVTSIGGGAFYGCSGLTSVTFNADSCTSAGSSYTYRAFYGCTNITNITFGDNVKVIPSYLCYGLSGLTEITSLATVAPSLGSDVFYNVLYSIPIHIPCGSTSSYQSIWTFFSNYVEQPILDIDIQTANSTMGVATITTQPTCFDSTAVITATANYGYHFTQWNDGDTQNPRTITLTQDTAFTAHFAKNSYVITVACNDNARGTVAGNDTVEYLDSITISATANYGYHFTRWQDNNTDNPRRVQVTQNMTYTAYFDYNQYNIALDVDTSIHGTVSGGGNYNYLSNCTITATTNYGYHFTQWSDGDTNNPRTITLTQDTAFTAFFERNEYTLTFQSADTTKGIVTVVSVPGIYLDTTPYITAAALPHYHFTQWNDGSTLNPRRFVIERDQSYTASFAIDTHTVSVQLDNIAHGTVQGGGRFIYGTATTVSATNFSGYHFAHWSDGSTYNPYTFAVLEDKNLTAIFIADGEPWQDTVILYDTTYVILHDTAYINVPVHDTTYIDVPVHDTTIVTDTVTMTEYVPVHDTTYIDVPYPVHDTTTVHDTTYVDVPYPVHDTTYIDVHDTTYIDVPYAVHDTTILHDTTYVNVPYPVHDTTYIDVHDTTYIDVPYAVHDTTYIDIHDTTYIDVPYAVHDTTYINVHDTTTVIDTVTNYIYDTTLVHDTTLVTDTLWLTQYDTIWLHDTIIIHDTIVVGVADVDAINAKIYTSNGQIVVDGTEGNTVWLYDINGRILAIKQDEYSPLRFDVSASGAYLVKIGNHPARKVVVIK